MTVGLLSATQTIYWQLSLSLVLGGLLSGYFLFCISQRLFAIMQQEHYEGRAFLRWYFKKGNITQRRITLLTISLILLLPLFNVCFSFLGYEWANCVALAPFVLMFGLYLWSERKYALKVKAAVTHRYVRLCVLGFILSAGISVGLAFGMTALSFAVDHTAMYLLRYAPFALLPLLTPLVAALANTLLLAYEIPRSKSFVKRARRALRASSCVKVGITGSFGKTSVKNYAAAILSGKYKVIATPSSFNTPLGIARTVNEGGLDCDIFLAEMGARHVGDISELCELVQPAYGVVTGVCGQHLETFGSLENVRKEKGELARCAKKCVLGSSCADMGASEPLVCGRDFGIENVVLSTDGTSFDLRIGQDSVSVKTALLGRHAAEDVALAAALASMLGMSMGEIAEGIARIESVPHRLVKIAGERGVTVLDDSYNANVEGAKNAVEVLSLFAGGKYVVTPGIVELGDIQEEENMRLGERLAGFEVILVGETLVRAVKDGYLKAGGDEAHIRIVPTLAAAQTILAEELQAGDCVLFLNDLPDVY